MSLNYTQLIDEVKAQLGKSSDVSLITNARVGRWLSQAQKDIVYAYPGLRDVNVLDKSTFRCAQNVYEYHLTELAKYPVAHIIRIKYVDEDSNDAYVLEPYPGGLDAWDNDYPNILAAFTGGGVPRHYCLRGYNIEILPAPGTNQINVPLWIEYSFLPEDMKGYDDAVFVGSGLDDLINAGTYTGTTDKVYRVQIDAEATPDTFKWSNNGGTTWNATTVAITGSAQTLEKGLTITFGATTGHTDTEYWQFKVDAPVLTNFDEVLIEWAKSYAFRLLGQTEAEKLMAAREQRNYAQQLAQERVEGEANWDGIDQIADYGP